MGTAQHKNAPALLTTRGINTTHQVYNFDLPQGAQKLSVIKFQMSYTTLIYLKGLKSY